MVVRAVWRTTARFADHFRQYPEIAWPPTLRDVLADAVSNRSQDSPLSYILFIAQGSQPILALPVSRWNGGERNCVAANR